MQRKKIDSFEAKTYFSQLITEVTSGDIIITKHSKPVAILKPNTELTSSNSVKESLTVIDNLHLRLNSSGIKEKLTIKQLINEGRKY